MLRRVIKVDKRSVVFSGNSGFLHQIYYNFFTTTVGYYEDMSTSLGRRREIFNSRTTLNKKKNVKYSRIKMMPKR